MMRKPHRTAVTYRHGGWQAVMVSHSASIGPPADAALIPEDLHARYGIDSSVRVAAGGGVLIGCKHRHPTRSQAMDCARRRRVGWERTLERQRTGRLRVGFRFSGNLAFEGVLLPRYDGWLSPREMDGALFAYYIIRACGHDHRTVKAAVRCATRLRPRWERSMRRGRRA